MQAGAAVRRLAPWLVLAISTLAVSLTLAGIAPRIRELQALFNPPDLPWEMRYTVVSEVLLAAVYFLTAGVIVYLRPRDRLTLFLALALVMIGATETGLTDPLINPEHNPGGEVWRPVVYALRSLSMTCALILAYIFPDGRFTPRYTRFLAAAWAALNLLWFLFPRIPFNPNDGPTWRATPVLSILFGVAWFSTGLAAQALRYRGAGDPVMRMQTRWTAIGLASAVLGTVVYYGILVAVNTLPTVAGWLSYPVWSVLRVTIQTVSLSLFPICLGVAVLRYHLWDLNLLINRALVYSALTVSVAGLYVLVVGGLGGVLEARGSFLPSLLAAALIAVLFLPLRDFLQRQVNRLIYGERDNPYPVIARLGQRLAGALSPDEVLPTIVETVAGALRLPYVAIILRLDQPAGEHWEVAAEAGRRTPGLPLEELPLINQGETVGYLWAAPRGSNEPFSPADRRLLEDLARQAGIAVQSVRLNTDLRRLSGDVQQARQALVRTREEERRRMHRNLHDGLGPTLAGLAFRLDTARNLLHRDPEQADQVLSDTIDRAQDAIEEIRRLVYDLRPPALDQLGLVSALCEGFTQLELSGVRIYLGAPNRLPPLPAAVEVAAYRIAMEAVNNVVRHAGAHRCLVRLRVEPGMLVISVRDDGRGLSRETRSGTGWLSMSERAAELGGTCRVEAAAGRGARVTAQLPFDQAAPPERPFAG